MGTSGELLKQNFLNDRMPFPVTQLTVIKHRTGNISGTLEHFKATLPNDMSVDDCADHHPIVSFHIFHKGAGLFQPCRHRLLNGPIRQTQEYS